jgi:hypothetical protein
MSEPFDPDPHDIRLPSVFWQHSPLPPWLARRLLREDEQVTWVRGPRFNPSWERYVTHPLLFVAALLLAGGFVALGVLIGGSWAQIHPAPLLTGIGLVTASIYVLAIANAYFTRLVVTEERLLILQGYEVCRSWRIDQLPPSLVRYARRGGGREKPVIDLNALQNMFGGPSDQIVDAKAIRKLGKQIDQIKKRENDP